MRTGIVLLLLLALFWGGSLFMDWGALAAIAAGLSLIISVMNTRKRDNSAHINTTVQAALHQFKEALNDKLDEKFASFDVRYIKQDTLDMRLKILEKDILHQHEFSNSALNQHDHRITRNQAQISMLMEEHLKSRREIGPHGSH